MNEDRYYSIGEVASICNIPIKTLRYYDNIQLVEPDKRDASSHYRYYSTNQILLLFIVRKLKYLGFSLKEIKALLDTTNVAVLQEHIETKLAALKKHIEFLENQHLEGALLLERLKKHHIYWDANRQQTWEKQEESFQIEEIPAVDVIFTRRIKHNYDNAGVSIDRWAEIMEMAEKNNLTVIGAITLTYHNAPLQQFYITDCDLEICLQVAQVTPLPIFKKFGGFKAVTAIHIGSHSTIYDTHIQAIKWLNKKGLKINGPISEEYIISPMDMKHEATYISKVIIPVEEV